MLVIHVPVDVDVRVIVFGGACDRTRRFGIDQALDLAFRVLIAALVVLGLATASTRARALPLRSRATRGRLIVAGVRAFLALMACRARAVALELARAAKVAGDGYFLRAGGRGRRGL